MSKSMQSLLIANTSLLILVSWFQLVAAGEPLQLKVAMRAESTQPTHHPILLTLSVTNSGDKPYYYAGLYLPGSPFQAVITDGTGNIRQAQMSNDRGGTAAPGWSGGYSKLLPGQIIDVPVCIDPLAPGSYKIEVQPSKRIEGTLAVKTTESGKVVVKNDPKLMKEWEADLLARIRKGDSFARYVAATYPNNSLIDLLIQQLLSDDSQVVSRVAYPLLRVQKLPDSSAAIISKAMDKHIAAAKQEANVRQSVLRLLADVAAKVGTDDALEPVLRLARTEEFRGGAVWALGAFKQEKALKELRLFLTDQDEELQFRAAQRLAESKDPPALEVLLTVDHDAKNRWRMYSFDALLKYPDDPRVEAAIKSGLTDSDSQVRQSAEFALRRLANQKKQKP